MNTASKSNKRVQNAWAFYDWANSVYPLVISTAIFPIFYNAVTTTNVNGQVDDHVSFAGISLVNTQLYSYVIACSLLIVMLIVPVLSGLADYAGKKKFFLQLFCYIGSAGSLGLYFFNPEHLEFSMMAVFFASIGYWASIVFYNAYLPEIATPEEHDRLSAKGFSWGYVGSVLLLIINLIMIMVVDKGLTAFSFVLVALWWAGFAQITFRRLPNNPNNRKPEGKLWAHGLRELKKVYREIRQMVALRRYLFAFFVFSMAVQTIMLMAQFFGMKEVHVIHDPTGIGWAMFPPMIEQHTGLDDSKLIIAIILVQLIAVPGAWVFSRGSGKLGNIRMLMIALSCWILTCLYAFLFVDTPVEFFVAAGLIGFMMGGTQSLGRSTYSKMLPETHDHASYFSFYDVLEKLGIVIGMISFGYIEGLTGSMRNSVVSLIAFFAIGLFLLFFVPKKDRLAH